MINCIIVEDEEDNLKLLTNLIERYCPNLTIMGWTDQVESAIEMIQKLKPDLLFLDIEIKGGTSFDILNAIEFKKIGIIFTTGYNQFAIKAFRYSALDYLLKPINFEELIDSVNKFRQANKVKQDDRLLSIQSNNQDKIPSSLIIPSSKGFTIHVISEIISLNSEGSYTKVQINKDSLLASKPLGHFEDLLPKNQFYRIHNQTIINIDLIKEYLKGKGGTVVMKNNSQFEVSERRKEGLLKLFQK